MAELTKMNEAKRAAEFLQNGKSNLFFSGAGMSTASGIPDFRSPGGVWAKYQPVYFDAFMASAEARAEYWRQKSEAHGDLHRRADRVARCRVNPSGRMPFFQAGIAAIVNHVFG